MNISCPQNNNLTDFQIQWIFPKEQRCLHLLVEPWERSWVGWKTMWPLTCTTIAAGRKLQVFILTTQYPPVKKTHAPCNLDLDFTETVQQERWWEDILDQDLKPVCLCQQPKHLPCIRRETLWYLCHLLTNWRLIWRMVTSVHCVNVHLRLVSAVVTLMFLFCMSRQCYVILFCITSNVLLVWQPIHFVSPLTLLIWHNKMWNKNKPSTLSLSLLRK